MKRHHIPLAALAALSLTATLFLSGCGTSSGYKQADRTGQGISEFRAEILNVSKAVDATMSSLDQIAATANSNPRQAYEGFSRSLADLDSAATKAKKRGDDMRAQGQAYFKQWETQLGEMSNPEIRALAQQQQTKLRQSFDSIRKYTEPLKAQFDPWLSDLKDLQKFLGTDLSISGIDAAKNLFTKTRTEGLEVQKSLDGLIGELNTVSATLTPANVKPGK
jgi:hypothetical protein